MQSERHWGVYHGLRQPLPALRSGTPDRDDEDEVLVALKAIVRVLDQQDEPDWKEIDRALNLGRDAIAKATGKGSRVA
jgi:hypothetical protein